MKRVVVILLAAFFLIFMNARSGGADTTLEKINRTGTLTIGTRTGSPPFAYINKNNDWVGFSIDLVEMLVKPSVENAVGRAIKIVKKESTPPTRIPLLTYHSVDLISWSITDTPQRRESE